MVKEKERSLNHLRAVRWWRRKNSLNHLRAHRSHAQCTAVCGRCKLPRTCRCSVDQNGAQGQCSRKYLQVLMSPDSIFSYLQVLMSSCLCLLLLKLSIDYAHPLFNSSVTVPLFFLFFVVRIPHKLGFSINNPKISNSNVSNCSQYF